MMADSGEAADLVGASGPFQLSEFQLSTFPKALPWSRRGFLVSML